MTWQMIIDEERDEALMEGMRRVALSQIKRRARKGLPFDEEFLTELSEDTGFSRQMLEEMAKKHIAARQLGIFEGEKIVADGCDFDEANGEIEKLFEGK